MQSLYVCHACKLYLFNVRFQCIFPSTDLLVNLPKSRNTGLIFIYKRADIAKFFEAFLIYFEISPVHRLTEYRIFASIFFVSMTSSPRDFYVCTLCVYAWGPAKYGGYRSNHSCTRVSPGTCVALRMSVRASFVSTCISEDMKRQEHARTNFLSKASNRIFCKIHNFFELFANSI